MLLDQYQEVISSLEEKGLVYEASIIQAMVGELRVVNQVMTANVKAASELLQNNSISAETLKEIEESESRLEIQRMTR